MEESHFPFGFLNYGMPRTFPGLGLTVGPIFALSRNKT